MYIDGIRAANERKLGAAVDDLNQAVQLDPKFGSAYELLAAAYLAQGRVDPAIMVLDRLRQIEPNRPHIYTRIAEAYSLLDASDLLRWAREAVIQEPRSPRAHMTLALALVRNDDMMGARAELGIVLQLSGGQLPPALRYEISVRKIRPLRFADAIRSSVSQLPY